MKESRFHIYDRICPECQDKFKTINSTKKYCTIECQTIAKHKRSREKYYALHPKDRPKKKTGPGPNSRSKPPQDGQCTKYLKPLLSKHWNG